MVPAIHPEPVWGSGSKTVNPIATAGDRAKRGSSDGKGVKAAREGLRGEAASPSTGRWAQCGRALLDPEIAAGKNDFSRRRERDAGGRDNRYPGPGVASGMAGIRSTLRTVAAEHFYDLQAPDSMRPRQAAARARLGFGGKTRRGRGHIKLAIGGGKPGWSTPMPRPVGGKSGRASAKKNPDARMVWWKVLIGVVL